MTSIPLWGFDIYQVSIDPDEHYWKNGMRTSALDLRL